MERYPLCCFSVPRWKFYDSSERAMCLLSALSFMRAVGGRFIFSMEASTRSNRYWFYMALCWDTPYSNMHMSIRTFPSWSRFNSLHPDGGVFENRYRYVYRKSISWILPILILGGEYIVPLKHSIHAGITIFWSDTPGYTIRVSEVQASALD